MGKGWLARYCRRRRVFYCGGDISGSPTVVRGLYIARLSSPRKRVRAVMFVSLGRRMIFEDDDYGKISVSQSVQFEVVFRGGANVFTVLAPG